MANRPGQLWNNRGRRALTYPSGCILPASPALSVVPLDAEGMFVPLEVKELIKTGSGGGGRQCQPLQHAVLLASEGLALAPAFPLAQLQRLLRAGAWCWRKEQDGTATVRFWVPKGSLVLSPAVYPQVCWGV